MYSIPHPVSAIRTRMRQEFERHRYVNKLPAVDVLLFQSNADYQVRGFMGWMARNGSGGVPWHGVYRRELMAIPCISRTAEQFC